MKNLFTLTSLFILGLVVQTNAQFLVGGNVGFSSMKETEKLGTDEEESKFSSITFIPRLGYVFGNNWAGIDVGMTSIKSEYPDFPSGTTEDKLNLISISPFFRFIKKPTDNMGIWLEAQAGAAFGKDETDGRELNKYSVIHAGIRPGVLFYVGNNLTFEASFGRLGFNQTTVKDADNSDSKTTTSNFGFNLNNNNFNIGFLGESLSITSGFLFGVNWTFGAAEAN